MHGALSSKHFTCALRAAAAARHQSSGDYAILARRRDLSITIHARSIGCDRRVIKREAGTRTRQGSVAIYGSTTIYGNYAECESPSSRLKLLVVDSSNSSRINHSPIQSHCARRGLVTWFFDYWTRRANGHTPITGQGEGHFSKLLKVFWKWAMERNEVKCVVLCLIEAVLVISKSGNFPRPAYSSRSFHASICRIQRTPWTPFAKIS